MKTRVFTLLASVVLGSIVVGAAFAQPNDVRSERRYVRASDEQYVVLTGSNIPRKVKVRPVGTDTPDNLRIYSQHELEASGKATTAEQLAARDASISIRRH